MRTLQILVQLIGALTLLSASALAAVAIFTNEFRLRDDTAPALRNDVRFVLNWGGLEIDQEYKVIHSYRSAVSLGDYIEYHCLQLENFLPEPRTAPAWVRGPEKDVIMTQARDLFAATGQIRRCFGAGAAPNEQTTAFFVHQLELNRAHDLSVDEPHITGGEVIFFHQPTNRLLYVGFET